MTPLNAAALADANEIAADAVAYMLERVRNNPRLAYLMVGTEAMGRLLCAEAALAGEEPGPRLTGQWHIPSEPPPPLSRNAQFIIEHFADLSKQWCGDVSTETGWKSDELAAAYREVTALLRQAKGEAGALSEAYSLIKALIQTRGRPMAEEYVDGGHSYQLALTAWTRAVSFVAEGAR